MKSEYFPLKVEMLKNIRIGWNEMPLETEKEGSQNLQFKKEKSKTTVSLQRQIRNQGNNDTFTTVK